MRKTTGGSPWQNEKNNIPRKKWNGTEMIKYRCFSCEAIQQRSTIGHIVNGDSWVFPCTECGAMLGPGGDHPGKKRTRNRHRRSKRNIKNNSSIERYLHGAAHGY